MSDSRSPEVLKDSTPEGASSPKRRLSPSYHPGHLPLGSVLVKENIITEPQLKEVVEIQQSDPLRLGEIIVEKGYASEMEILQAISKEYGVSAQSLSEDIAGQIRNRRLGFLSRMYNIRIPIRMKLTIAITLITWFTILSLSFTILIRQRGHLYDETVKMGMVTLNFFAKDAAISLLDEDMISLNNLIKETTFVDGLLYAVITDKDGIVMAHSDPSMIGSELTDPEGIEKVDRAGRASYFKARLPAGKNALILSQTIEFSNVEIGEVRVGISLDFIDDRIMRESAIIIVLSLLIILLGISIAAVIGTGFSRPIAQLVRATQEVGKGNFNQRIREVRKDELGELATAFNFMSRELWKKLKMQKSFGSYVSPEILKMILANPDDDWLKGTRMDVSILFTDIRGFTRFSEENEPETVVEKLNEYFHIATKHIVENGGHVDKFIGDAVLGIFGAPAVQPDHALRSVRAALNMQSEFDERGSAGNALLDRVGIGINSGEAVAGDLGSEAKKEYSVIGDCVNLASRLNSLAKSGQIIISRNTYQEVGDILSVKTLETVTVKGKTQATETFELVSLNESPRQDEL